MKIIHVIWMIKHALTLCILGSFYATAHADWVELRTLSLKGEDISIQRLQELLRDDAIGHESTVKITLEDGKFLQDNTKRVFSVLSYSPDGTIVTKERVKYGLKISGTAQRVGQYYSINLTYWKKEKLNDLISHMDGEGGNKLVIAKQQFKEFKFSSTILSDTEGFQWGVVRTVAAENEKGVKKYIAMRFHKDTGSKL